MRALECFEVNQAILTDRKIAHPKSVLLETMAGVEHGLVLGDSRDDVIALRAIALGHALDREIVALSRAGGENDFLWGRAD